MFRPAFKTRLALRGLRGVRSVVELATGDGEDRRGEQLHCVLHGGARRMLLVLGHWQQGVWTTNGAKGHERREMPGRRQDRGGMGVPSCGERDRIQAQRSRKEEPPAARGGLLASPCSR